MDRLFLSARLLAEEAPEPHLGWAIVPYLALVWLVIAVFAYYARKGFGETIFKSKPAQWAEQAYLFIESMCINVIGPHGRKYIPLVMTIWMVVFTSNFLGLLLPHTPSADWSLNLGLAIIVFCYVQWEGMKIHFDHMVAHGTNAVVAIPLSFLKHLRHFAGPKLHWALTGITVLLFFIEIVSELLRILTLSIRLYGNIHGGHEVRQSLDHLVSPVSVGGGAVLVPLGIFVLPLEVLVAIIQAMVFTILTCVYLAMVTSHEEEGEHAEHAEHAGQAAQPAMAQ
ncbi:MAG TPA: F0F1 ATP synthase subunit A [Fimbriimonadaceae bacterium]|nr:F0F1 ATP synthase subunit A [Fimbriimonadaceae bacterium]